MSERGPGASSIDAAADASSLPQLRTLLAGVLAGLPQGSLRLDADLEHWLNEWHGPSAPSFARIREVCRAGIEERWACSRERGGIRYGRVLHPAEELRQCSVDVVDMQDVVGPQHQHPLGEIDLILPLHGDARFDGRAAGWLVYPPESSHSPTVSGGRALILYLLPEGKIHFSGA